MGDNAFKKKSGQNFLINPRIPERIAEEGALEGVLEIGPGIGTLTKELCKRAKKVVAIEIDRDLIPILDITLAEFDNVKVINADVTKLDLTALIREEFGDMEVSVCANLPYYITSPIIMQLLEEGAGVKKITVMVQKEFADRLCSSAGSEEYGAITAACAYFGKARRLFTVAAGNFMPKPKVDSAVLTVDVYDAPIVDTDRKMLFKVIKAAFGMRRKTLANALTSVDGLSKEDAESVITLAGFDKTVRGEKLDIHGFARVAEEIIKLKG
jgi:16S rRNA (adenine1518-N6/adenine1519-N6)-dimethyltransferase